MLKGSYIPVEAIKALEHPGNGTQEDAALPW
jgi:hypothetical protein